MAEFTIEAKARAVVGKKVRRLRREGFVPGTIYGPKTEPLSVQFPYRELQTALMQAGGTNLIDITLDGETYPVLAREVQRDILKRTILHVDFLAVDMATKIRADIPVRLNGESPVVAARKGVLLTGPNFLTVEMLASRLINSIEVDLSELQELGDSITVSDLHLDDITIINDPDEMIAKVVQTSAARAAALEAIEAEEGGEVMEEEIDEGAEPEVIGRGKDEDDFEE